MSVNQPDSNTDKHLSHGWHKLVKAFGYEYQTLAEEFLFDSHSTMNFESSQLPEILAWARQSNLIEPADEIGRVRLTAKGRASWRVARDPV